MCGPAEDEEEWNVSIQDLSEGTARKYVGRPIHQWSIGGKGKHESKVDVEGQPPRREGVVERKVYTSRHFFVHVGRGMWSEGVSVEVTATTVEYIVGAAAAFPKTRTMARKPGPRISSGAKTQRTVGAFGGPATRTQRSTDR